MPAAAGLLGRDVLARGQAGPDRAPAGLAIADVLGSTEGGMGQSIMTKDTPAAETARFSLSPTTKVFTDDGREVQPGSGEVGHGGERRARADRLLQGPGEVGPHVPRGRRQAVVVPRRHGQRRRRRHARAVRPRLELHQHRRREGVPRGGRGGAQARTPPSRTRSCSACPTSASAARRRRGVAEPGRGGDGRGGRWPTPASACRATSCRASCCIVERVPRAPNGKADYRAARAMFD